ncbi:hypothetical protein AN478_05980 [Thiohalorhabdus denitrificans]|uniref:histidine kinase n=1 Tax=Thiohalorhabdus denitrificans TaxID=381306 RepID=A0A0P9EQD2_9GAMM|nr:ATP-binding protein [Thiohalorhabdus denitrificans]KPV40703.1 hypothetical protein AN478_05980 [Thiohalorhabdus denitrificans]SCY46534.1 Signal transduction histidine kinase [Thiohalorhabdus denitrificans]
MQTNFLLPEESGEGWRLDPRHRWVLTWGVALVLLLPPIALLGLREQALDESYVLALTHGVVEGFCGLVALLVVVAAGGIYFLQPRNELLFFTLAFLAMGLFDLIHAISEPGSERFVALHSLSVAWGALLMLTAYLAVLPRMRLDHLEPRKILTAVLVPLVGSLLLVYWVPDQEFLAMVHPSGRSQEFTWASIFLNGAAGVLFTGAALLCFAGYRRSGELSLGVFTAIHGLFAESAFLFPLSTLWDINWWLWHGVKVLLYMGILAFLVFGYIYAVRKIQGVKNALSRSNERLQEQQEQLEFSYRVLSCRTTITECGAGTLDMERILETFETAVGRLVGPVSGRFYIDASVLRNPDLLKDELLGDSGAERLAFQEQDNRAAESGRGVCVDVHAHGRRLGRLSLCWGEAEDPGQDRMGEILSMVDGASQALAGAILYRETVWEGGVQDTMQTIVSMINSAGDVRDILNVVCRDGARLLKAEAAAIWLADAQEDSLRRYACCHPEFSPMEGRLGEWPLEEHSGPLERVLRRNRPEAVDLTVHPKLRGLFAQGGGPCRQGAIFPVEGRDGVLGLLVLCRNMDVPFSGETMAKAQLLAMHAGMALQDAFLIQELSATNEQLQRTQREKIRSEKLAAIGQMSAGIAHEIRNPLGAMSNCLKILNSPGTGEHARDRALRILEEEARRLEKTASDFLDFARPAGEMLRESDPRRLLASVEEEAQAHLAGQDADIQLLVDAPPALPMCRMDSDRLRQALWNLFLNAVKACGDAGRIRLCGTSLDGELRLAVEDDGRGIEPEQMEDIFEPFFTTNASGSGLGLAIVKQVVESQGGRVEVSSVPGSGTTVALILPLTEEAHVQRSTVSGNLAG